MGKKPSSPRHPGLSKLLNRRLGTVCKCRTRAQRHNLSNRVAPGTRALILGRRSGGAVGREPTSASTLPSPGPQGYYLPPRGHFLPASSRPAPKGVVIERSSLRCRARSGRAFLCIFPRCPAPHRAPALMLSLGQMHASPSALPVARKSFLRSRLHPPRQCTEVKAQEALW